MKNKNHKHKTATLFLILMGLLLTSLVLASVKNTIFIKNKDTPKNPMQLKTAADFGSADVEFMSGSDDIWVSIGDNITITYTNNSYISSVMVNLTHYGGNEAEPLYNDGTHGDTIAGDNDWTLYWTVKDPAPYGIENYGPNNLKITASNGTDTDVEQVPIENEGISFDSNVDTILPVLDNLIISDTNISRDSGNFKVSLEFSEEVHNTGGVQQILSFSPDIYGIRQFYHTLFSVEYEGNSNRFTAINITYMVNLSHYDGTFQDIDVNISTIEEASPSSNSHPNILREDPKEFPDLFSIDIKNPQNPNSYNSYSHIVEEYSNNNTLCIEWMGQSDEGSGIKGYWIVWDEQEFNDAGAFNGYFTTSTSNTTILNDGSWYLHIHTVDNFGNDAGEDFSPTSYHVGPFNIDTTSPLISVSSPANESTFGSTAPTFSLYRYDLHLDTTWYSLDGGQTNRTITNYTGQIISQVIWNNLNEGQINIIFYQNDTAGNTDSCNVVVYKDLSVDNIDNGADEIGGFEIIFFIASISLAAIIIVINKKNDILL